MKNSGIFPPETLKLLKVVYSLSQERNVRLFLVGGALRDILARRLKDNPDIDFCLRTQAIAFAKAVAKKMSAGFVILDREHGCARVVKKATQKTYTLDFTDFKGHTLEEDLRNRDFTVNSLALEVKELFGKKAFLASLIDPHGGRKDLERHIIRMIAPKGFDEDPLRILRAFSLASLFDFAIEKKTLVAAAHRRNRLKSVAGERIRDEVFRIFSAQKSFECIQQLAKHRILEIVFPEIKAMQKRPRRPYRGLDVFGHSLLTLKHLEGVIAHIIRNQEAEKYLKEEFSLGRQRASLVKLVGLLHDVGKPQTFRVEKGKVSFHGHERVGAGMIEEIGSRLKLSNAEVRSMKQMTFSHLRPGYLATNPVLTRRAKFRFFRDTAAEAVSVLLISLADQRATHGYLTVEKTRMRHERMVRRLIGEYFASLHRKKQHPLVNGNILMRRFGLKPSPLIGTILKELRELQAIGKIKTTQGALEAAAKIITP
ncbi:MAG: HDIG domain-containing protein [Candidatus Omnitrophota bacterium]|jgi:poly(A) polymerase|nr:MAG: HDIG domain-containing protein [Candidatus Omnitrophota bacterium]